MNKRAQSTIEFTFTMIVIFVLAYGLIKVFRWAGMDLAERRWALEDVITTGNSPEEQLSPAEFYRPKRINPQYINGQ